MLSLIVAVDQNMGIGKNNQLPWHYPEDLAYFKQITSGHTVCMGHHTFTSIGKPLPKRQNIVFSRHIKAIEGFDDVEVISDPVEYFQAQRLSEAEIFVIGGSMIYELALPYVDKMYITHIQKAYDVDSYFPDVEWNQFTVAQSQLTDELFVAIYERIIKK